VPDTVCPCWLVKYPRPLPAHSTATERVVAGSRRSSSSENVTGPPRRPAPKTSSRQAAVSMIGVLVWLRTKNRSIGTW
jgi:hypothetical protein